MDDDVPGGHVDGRLDRVRARFIPALTDRAIGAAEASARILDAIERTPVEHVPIEASVGRVLAEPLVARLSIPPWRSASMDGYAVKATDIARVPRTLRVVGDVVAGSRAAPDIASGDATKIMTGAPVPPGADSVVRIEDTDGGATSVEIRNARDAGRNVRSLGEDFNTGDLLMRVGERITPAAVGVLASAGVATVATYRIPRVSIVASGDELVRIEDFDLVLRGERIVSSNSYSLPAMIRDAGAIPLDGGITADDPSALRAAIEAAMDCDLLITSGGVSVGERDYTRAVMKDMGADIIFWRARIRPGGPIAFGIVNGKPWIGLPGNPVSALVTFELFIRPAVLKMLGETMLFPQTHAVTLDETVTVSGDLIHFLRVTLTRHDDGLHCRLTGTQSSGALTSMIRADALLIVPEGRREWLPGEQLRAIPLRDSMFRSTKFPS